MRPLTALTCLWIALTATVAVGAGWAVTLAGLQTIEGAPLIFGLGMAWSTAAPGILRAIWRAARRWA